MTRNIIFLFLASVVFISCKKDNSEVYTQSAKDAALGEVLIVDVLKQILYTSPNFLIDEQDSIINEIILYVGLVQWIHRIVFHIDSFFAILQ